MAKAKPFICNECGKQLTFGEAAAASWRGCPKCGGSDVEVNPAAGATVTVEILPGRTVTFGKGA